MFDRATTLASGNTCTLEKTVLKTVRKCEQWTDHVSTSTINNIQTALDENNFPTARFFFDIGQEEDANPLCIEILRQTINLAEADAGFGIEYLPIISLGEE